jgi:hypothetical protein
MQNQETQINEEVSSDNNTGSEPLADSSVPKRDEKGRLLPGNTANPKGRPKRKTIRDYYTEEEIEDLINKLKLAETPDMIRTAIEHIFGKPKQPLVGGDEDDPAIKTISQINYIVPKENGNNSASDNQTASSL